jgi:hypothetical protein
MIAVLTALAVTLIDQVTNETIRASGTTNADGVYQTAEAGIGDYVGKLDEDPNYYDHWVDKGEATRTSCTTYTNGTCTAYGALVVTPDPTNTANNGWPSGTHWGYNSSAPNHKDTWFQGTGNGYGNSTLLKGYAYDLMITPPSSSLGTKYVTILSTGCKLVSGGTTCDPTVPERSVMVQVNRSTPADFQYMTPDMSGVNVCFGSNLYGKVYSVGSINVCGANAYGNLLADNGGSVTSMTSDGHSGVTLHGTARIYDKTHPDIRTVVPNPISFSQLTVSLANIQRAAATNSPPTVFDDSSAAAWRVNFSSNGTYQVWKCIWPSGSSTSDPAFILPFCGGDLTLASSAAKNARSITVNGSTSEFPSTGTIYIGPNSSNQTDSFNYTGLTGNSFSSTSDNLSYAHAAGERVSIFSGGISWNVPYQTGSIPSNGAIYTAQDAMISWPTAIGSYNTSGCPTYVGTPASTVNGRVTLASNGDINVAGNICYASQTPPNPNDDVLGLVANNNIWIADDAPNNLWWRASTIALNGAWGDYDVTNNKTKPTGAVLKNSMTFVGTSAYASAAGAMQDANATYGYNISNVNRVADDGSMVTAGVCPTTAPDCANYNALSFLFPPWFPVLNGENIGLFQDVQASTVPPVG